MKKSALFLLSTITIILTIISCKKEKEGVVTETMLSGNTTIFVDESIFPIVEDQRDVFENTYRAQISLNSKSEAEIINDMIDDSARISILTRMLTDREESASNSKATPKITKFAIDAIVFIVNKKSQDSVIQLDEVSSYLNGNNSTINNLVFDNPNSSVVRNLFEKLNINKEKINTIYSQRNSEELIKFISENEGHIGVIGINWLTQTPTELLRYSENIRMLSVQNVKSEGIENEYIYPSQANIGKKTYPLTRELFLLNYQGTKGLGMGFASFVASDIGQKIILTSGLAPVKLEPMNINIKKENK